VQKEFKSEGQWALAISPEAAHICHNSDVVMLLSARLKTAFQSRNAAILDLTNHETTHAHKKPAEIVHLSKRESAWLKLAL
jgi:hypothetical protein